MKNRKQITYSTLILLFLIQALFFTGCKPDKNEGKGLYKPNIYIYPEENIQLKVTIDFPLGGHVTESIPYYGNGWEVNVDTAGVIDNEYNYLFYESIQPDIWQKGEGWIVEVENLESFFRDNMKAYGFEGAEIEDFIEYWIPRLKSYDYYMVYPQTSELIVEAVQLNFSEEPDAVLRLFYLVEDAEKAPEYLAVPEIKSFIREGYFATEWGVIL